MDSNSTEVALASLLGKRVHAVARTGRGGNSKVYRVACADGTTYAAKFYFQRTMDGRDRLDVEFGGLSFLWSHGVRWIPQPIAADRASQIALYEFIDGNAIIAPDATPADINAIVQYASVMRGLAKVPEADGLPTASEACFSPAAVVKTIEARLARLGALEPDTPSQRALRSFLSDRLLPTLSRTVEALRARYGATRWESELHQTLWTLSPSDFGFHNALRRRDGSLLLLDFEYFGKDDPAKMIADFVLHPAMDLSEEAKAQYVSGMMSCFGADPGLHERLRTLYPLFGYKWCTILLNEFIPRFLERRQFAAQAASGQEEVRMRQLGKAERMLDRIVAELQNYPYPG